MSTKTGDGNKKEKKQDKVQGDGGMKEVLITRPASYPVHPNADTKVWTIS